MITKERLEQLIEQGATIYSNEYGEIQLIKENDLSLYENGQNNYILYALEPNKKYHNEIFDEDLFETKEDAEEYAEFGNITRTDTLKFPIWEDIKDKGYDEIFFVKDNRFDSGVVQYYFLVAEQTKEIQIMFREIDHLMIITAYDVIFNKPLTRENYNEARRLCVKLFNGEDV